MVAGLDKFREYFAGHEDKYAVIGGSACDIIFNAAGVPFRATKDIDMVLCVEVVDPGFGRQFSAFLQAGGYEAQQRADGKPQFYRFSKPKDEAFPFMIELFSKAPKGLGLPETAILTPITAEDDLVSLSAILLDQGYYDALLASKRVEDNVSILDERLLIPFKAKAFLDLSDRKAAGGKVDQKNINKHMLDVFRLLQLLAPEERVELPDGIRTDLKIFVARVSELPPYDQKALKLPFSMGDGLSRLSDIYVL